MPVPFKLTSKFNLVLSMQKGVRNYMISQSMPFLAALILMLVSCKKTQHDARVNMSCSPSSSEVIFLIQEVYAHLYPNKLLRINEHQHAGKMLKSLWENDIDLMSCSALPDSTLLQELAAEGFWWDTFAYGRNEPQFPMDVFESAPIKDSLFPLIIIGRPEVKSRHFRSFILSDKGQWITYKHGLIPRYQLNREIQLILP